MKNLSSADKKLVIILELVRFLTFEFPGFEIIFRFFAKTLAKSCIMRYNK